MNKCYIYNLAMIVTNKCNLDCSHCLRGTKDDNCMSDKVIEATLDQVAAAGNIAICGGEPTLSIDRIEKIISYAIEKHIIVKNFTITINGTTYSKQLLELLDEINRYMGNDAINAFFEISLDKYHLDEITKLGIKKEFYENLKRYQESKYFLGYRDINQKLFREGNAENMDKNLTIPLRPMKKFITYVGKNGKFDRENGLCNIGPLITINPNGIITECDASIEHQETLYNYGNIVNSSIEEIVLDKGELILKPKKFDREVNKALNKYLTYNR